MKKLLFYLFLMFFTDIAFSQPTPASSNAKPVANKPQGSNCNQIVFQKVQRTSVKKGEKVFPEKFEAFICFNKGQSTYTEESLDILDSVYKIAFDKENNKFYKITIIGYDDAEDLKESNTNLARERAITIFNYFAGREETEYIIRRTPSKSFHSCEGETEYIIKYKMPFDFKWENLNQIPQAERNINGIDLTSRAYVLIENKPEECLGKFKDYYYPSQDTTLVSKSLSMLKIPKGELESLTHTKEELNNEMTLTFEEKLSFEELTKDYNLVPHRRQYIINAGYFVVKSNRQPSYETCKLKDKFAQNITIRLPLEEQQIQARLRFYARTYNPNGTWDYKAVTTKKERDRETKMEAIIGSFSAFQLDTIYVGKKIDEKEMSDYFYPAKEGEPGAFQAMGGWLKPYKLDKRGSIVMKKQMRLILRRPIGDSTTE